MYFGRVYYWHSGIKVFAFHFGKFQTYVESKYWYDKDGVDNRVVATIKLQKL